MHRNKLTRCRAFTRTGIRRVRCHHWATMDGLCGWHQPGRKARYEALREERVRRRIEANREVATQIISDHQRRKALCDAAPVLLATLKALVDRCIKFHDTDQVTGETFYNMASGAIARAEK